MNRQESEKWLDELISQTINTTKPQFDPDKWKQKYPEEFELLKSRAKKTPAITQPSIWKIVLKSGITRLAAAAVIIAAVGSLIAYRSSRKQEYAQVASAAQSPAKMMTAISLTMAYRRGGMEAVERQFDKALKMLGPRPASISLQELLENFNG